MGPREDGGANAGDRPRPRDPATDRGSQDGPRRVTLKRQSNTPTGSPHPRQATGQGPMTTDDQQAGSPKGEADTPGMHIVLVEPEIAANVGAIGRTCVAAGAKLWLV